MTVPRIVHAFAGTLVLAGIALALAVSPWFLAIGAFAGANLLQSAFTRFCLLAILLRRLGVPDPTPERARVRTSLRGAIEDRALGRGRPGQLPERVSKPHEAHEILRGMGQGMGL